MKRHWSRKNFNYRRGENNLQILVMLSVANSQQRTVNFTSQVSADNYKAIMIYTS